MGCCCSSSDDHKARIKRRQENQQNNKSSSNEPTTSNNNNNASSSTAIAFNLNGPDSEMTGSNREPIACFEQGLLYRVADDDSWYFYNDAFDHEMKIMYLFGPNSELEIGPKVTMTRQNDGWLRASLNLLPGETEHFVSGKASGYSSHFDMKPLTEEHIAKLRRDRNEKILGQSSFLLRNLAPSISRHRMANLSSSSSNGSGGGVNSGVGGGSNNNNIAITWFISQATSLTSPYYQQQEEIEQLAMQLCQANRTFFVDPIFFPNESSLGATIPATKNFPWYRYKEVLPTRYHGRIRIAENVRPGDIVPGELGDSTFMGAVASIAEIPELVRRLFPVDEQTLHLSKLGAYRVRLIVDGLWTTILVDDYFPMRGLRPAFARHRRDSAELYLQILQKAFAKRCGSYYALTGVNALHTLNDMTGFPCTRLDTLWEAARNSRAAANDLFETLLSYSRAGFIIVLQTPHAFDRAFAAQFGCASTTELANRYRASGMKLGHAYNIQRLVMFRKKDLMLMKLRNPWSLVFEWAGDWSDTSSKWREHPEVAEVCRFKKSDDGFFWMSFFDAIQWFVGGTVCRSRLSWYDYRIPAYFGTDGFASVSVEIDNTRGEDRVAVAISLTHRRLVGGGGSGGAGGNASSSNSGGGGGGGGGMFDDGTSNASMMNGGGGGGIGSSSTALSSGSDDAARAILLSIWRVTKDGEPFQLLGNSTPNPEVLSTEFNYLFSRDVSVDLVIDPGCSLLVVPCCGGANTRQGKTNSCPPQAIVLSIQTSKQFDTENISTTTATTTHHDNNNSNKKDQNGNDDEEDEEESDINYFQKQQQQNQNNNDLKNKNNRNGGTNRRNNNSQERGSGNGNNTHHEQKYDVLLAGFRTVPDVRGAQSTLIDRDNDLEIVRSNYQRRNPNGTIDGYADAYNLS